MVPMRKGSGRTPFSRGADGKAALGPVLREYLMGEAMFALGIPTTRALAVVTTGEQILREDGLLPGAETVYAGFDPYRNGTSAPGKVYEIWTTQARWMNDHVDNGVLTVLMHPQVIGRAHGMDLLERFIHYCKRLNMRFMRMDAVAKALPAIQA